MLGPFAHPVVCCWMLLRVVTQSLKSVKIFSQQLPTLLLFRDRRRVAQQCWIRLHSSSNIVKATHADYAWFTKTYWLYPSHDALQVPTLLGVVASVCRPLLIRTQQLPTLLAQQCWDWLVNNNAPVCMVLKVWPVSNFAQQHATTSNKMQQGVQTDATCNIQQRCARLHSAKSLTGFKLCPTTRNKNQQNATGCANGRNM